MHNGGIRTIDAIGPETFRYSDMVEMIGREIESRALILPIPPLTRERLYVDAPPLGETKLSDWVRASVGG